MKSVVLFGLEAAALVALVLLQARGGAAQAPAFATLYSFQGGDDGAAPKST